MLYGINTGMNVLGVSDGTCNQINPDIFQQNNICGMGSAGGNRCMKDAYGIENFTSNCNNNNYSQIITIVLIVIILLGIFYIKSYPETMK